MKSEPTLCAFDPTIIPYQYEVIDLIRNQWDYNNGNPEILMSGSYGSAKSTVLAHLAATHCLRNPKGVVCIARKALPDIKRTIFNEIIEHIAADLVDGVDYKKNETTATITFANGAKIISASWSDKRYKKFRSLKISMLIFEEIVENNDDDEQAFKELKARLRRIPEVKENVLIAATNPDSPDHWVFKYFIETVKPTRFVFYSNTEENIFLDPLYIKQLLNDLTDLEVERFIRGKWVEILTERIYYSYDKDLNHRDYSYKVDCNYQIHVTFDFNIGGPNKPMSACLMQYIPDDDGGVFHIFAESVVEGLRTESTCDEFANRGLLNFPTQYIINGDATGRARSTNSIKSNYDIIKTFFSNYKVIDENGKTRPMDFKVSVPLANPAIRERHSTVNVFAFNANHKRRLFTYRDTPVAKKGLTLAALKKGAVYQENDDKPYQHITTAIGYSICRTIKDIKRGVSTTIQL